MTNSSPLTSTANSERLQEDAANREKVLSLKSFIVSAPAGSGKTELLTQRFLFLLAYVDNPEEVVAMTFTKKAANEMQERILSSLQVAKENQEPKEPHKKMTFVLAQKVIEKDAEFGWSLLDNPTRLRIRTMDSFSTSIVQQLPILSRLGGTPTPTADDLAYIAAIKNTLKQLDNTDPDYQEYTKAIYTALAYLQNDQSMLIDICTTMLKKREQWMPYLLQYTHDMDLARALEDSRYALVKNRLKTLTTLLTSELQKEFLPAIRYAVTNLIAEQPLEDKDRQSLQDLQNQQDPLDDSPENLKKWLALMGFFLTDQGEIRKRLDKNRGFPPKTESGKEGESFKQCFKNILEQLREHPSAQEIQEILVNISRLPLPETENIDVIKAFIQILKLACAELWLVFQQTQTLDFVEVNQRALQAIDGEEDIATRLDYQISHLLIDEFQDTNSLQIRFIERLTENWQTNKTLFLVGDPMQSIYRFRKANVGLFLQRIEEKKLGHITLEHVQLYLNNRADPRIVDWINAVFPSIFPEEDDYQQEKARYRHFYNNKPEDETARVHIHPLSDKEMDETEDEDMNEEKDDIKLSVAEKVLEIIQTTKNTWQKLPQDQNRKIAVLVRARSHVNTLVHLLNREEIPFQAIDIDPLVNRQVIEDLCSLTYALHNRTDRVHWLALLRSPFCGLKLADMYALAGAVYGKKNLNRTVLSLMEDTFLLAHLSEDGRRRIERIRSILQEALLHYGQTHVHRWIYGTWLMLGGDKCLYTTNDIRDIQAFFHLLGEMEESAPFQIYQLKEKISKLYAKPSSKGEELQIMTIHGAKGLEFDTVVLPSLEKGKGRNDQDALLWKEVFRGRGKSNILLGLQSNSWEKRTNTMHSYLKVMEKEGEEYEIDRLLYVAVTRAKRELHLIATQEKGDKNSFLARLCKSPHFEDAFEKNKTIISAQTKETTAKPAYAKFSPKFCRLPFDIKSNLALQTTDKIETLSFTTSFSKSEQNHAAKIAEQLQADVGTLTHRYLKLISEEGIEKWTKIRIDNLQQAMQMWFLNKQHKKEVAIIATKEVVTLLQTVLDSEKGRWILKQRDSAQNELALWDEIESKQKIIDRTFVENNVRWIIDYKTDKLPDETIDLSEFIRQREYDKQLEGYARLFADEGVPIQKQLFFIRSGMSVPL